MSNSPAPSEYKPLCDVVAPVNAKVTFGKDSSKAYVGLENIPSRGSKLLSWEKANSSISTNSLFNAGDILFGKLRPNLRKCIAAPFNGYCSTDVLVLRAVDDIVPDFAVRVLQSEKVGAAAERSAIGTKMPRTSWEHLSDLLVFCPNPEEQRKVASVLASLDASIEFTEGIVEKLKRIRQGLLNDLLNYGVNEQGQLRDPLLNPEDFHETRLGKLPKNWNVLTLGAAISMQAGMGLTGEDIADVGLYPVFGGNGHRGFTSRYTHEGRFVLIGRQGALCGNIAVASGKFFATEHAVICTPVLPVSSGWLACYLERMNLNRFSEASAQPGLSVQKISEKYIAMPTIDEQVAIEARLSELDILIQVEVSELGKLSQLKLGLREDLISGRVRVTPLLAQ
jgi:type I restriction enzyme S subunit